MEGQEGDSNDPTSAVPFTPRVRRSTRKSTLGKTCNIQIDSVVQATKYSGDADTQQERQEHKELSLLPSIGLPHVRRSTRKSNSSKISNNQVDAKVQASTYLREVDSEKERQGDKELGLAILNSSLQVRRSTRKSRSSQTSDFHVDSEVQANIFSANTKALEERQGDQQLRLDSFEVDALLEADHSEKERCKQSWINGEQEEREASQRIQTNSDDLLQQKNLEDGSEREGCKESSMNDEQDEREVSQQILTTNSDVQKQQKNLEGTCMKHAMINEPHDQFNDVNLPVEDGEEDDEKMAALLSRSFRSQLFKMSTSSTKGSIQEQHTMQDAKNGGSSYTLPRSDIIHSDGEKQRITMPPISSLKVSWTPSYGLPFLDDKQQKGRKGGYEQEGVPLQPNKSHPPLGCSEAQLRDGLFVPPNDMRKLKKILKEKVAETAGEKWFNMPAPTITPELKKELQLLKLRAVINPKRHYKAEDSKSLPKYFQIGTVVEGPADFFSGRLTNKERKTTFADELLSDSSLARYRKRKFGEIQNSKQAGGKNFWKKKKNRQKPSWAKV